MKPNALVLLTAVAAAAAGCAAAPPVVAPPPPTFEQKLANILRLEDRRILADPVEPSPPPASPPRRKRQAVAPPPPRIDDLAALLQDGEGRVRRRAALAIGRVGLVAGVAPLSGALKDPDPEVREMAAFALGLIGDRSAVPALTTALHDPSPRVQGRAAEALGLLDAKDAAPEIGRMVAFHAAAAAAIDGEDLSYPLAPSVEAFRLGVYALTRLKAWEPLASVVLAPSGEPRVRWWPVAYALQRLQDPRAVPALLWFVRQGGVEAASFAARGLGLIDSRPSGDSSTDAGVVPTLEQIVQTPESRDHRVVVAAIRSLGQIGDKRAVASLMRLIQRPQMDDDNLRLEAVAALGALRATDAVSLLVDLTGARWAALRGAAFTALAGADPESLLFVLSSIDEDSSWTVRAEIASALSTLEPQLAVPRLSTMLKDADARVLPRVLDGLVTLDAPGVDDVLIQHLRHPDVVVRSVAATHLGVRKPQAALGPLVEAYRAAKSDSSYIARAATLVALSKYGGDEAGDAIRDALADPDWAVRRRAAELMRGAEPGSDAGVIRPAPTRYSPGDYANPALLQPSYSPQAYFETAKGTVQVELAVLDAPLTVSNFVALVRQGFFDGLTVHRVVPNFVVQDGDPRGDGEGGPGYTIRDEINTRPYLRGTVGMALDWADTGGSQFFITHGPQPHLDGRYTVFGQVVAGQEIVDRVVRGEVIEHVRVWNGVEWIDGSRR